ncbi:hypothetical protein B0T24DRAFT_591464 [Lasiosphaeria ovina]|uniref:Uncharacterized protein n=1 Tax=Lasiosphaeria ovina TaxID=92902 RepID=A0AAE0N9I3_9PEZI|nr:hypothetical protein B0T24DRAFT_591464 [Lasiosphaeria ovina]
MVSTSHLALMTASATSAQCIDWPFPLEKSAVAPESAHDHAEFLVGVEDGLEGILMVVALPYEPYHLHPPSMPAVRWTGPGRELARSSLQEEKCMTRGSTLKGWMAWGEVLAPVLGALLYCSGYLKYPIGWSPCTVRTPCCSAENGRHLDIYSHRCFPKPPTSNCVFYKLVAEAIALVAPKAYTFKDTTVLIELWDLKVVVKSPSAKMPTRKIEVFSLPACRSSRKL